MGWNWMFGMILLFIMRYVSENIWKGSVLYYPDAVGNPACLERFQTNDEPFSSFDEFLKLLKFIDDYPSSKPSRYIWCEEVRSKK